MNMFFEGTDSSRRLSDSGQCWYVCSGQGSFRRSSSFGGCSNRRQSWSQLAVVSLALLSTTAIRNTPHCAAAATATAPEASFSSQHRRLPADLISETAAAADARSSPVHHGGLQTSSSSYRQQASSPRFRNFKGHHHFSAPPPDQQALTSNGERRQFSHAAAPFHQHHQHERVHQQQRAHMSPETLRNIGRRSKQITTSEAEEQQWRKWADSGRDSSRSSRRWHPTTSLAHADMSPLASALTIDDRQSTDWLLQPEQPEEEEEEGKPESGLHQRTPSSSLSSSSSSAAHHSRTYQTAPPVDIKKVPEQCGGSQQQRRRQHSKRQASMTSSSLLLQQQAQDNNRMIALLSKLPCRTEWGLWFPYEHYVIDSCARCYHYMPESAFKPGLKYSYVPYLYLYHEALNSTFLGNDTYNLLFTFGSVALFNKWRQCCNEAIICCANYHKQYPGLHKAVPLESMEFSAPVADIDSSSGGGGSGGGQLKWWQVANESAPVDLCPPTWDGWLCWDEFARPSQVLEQSCPKHIYWHQLVPPCRGYVTKKCNESGQWFQNKEHKEWSNYTMCARDDIYARRIEYSLVTNIISMCALIPALIIFTYYKQLSSMSRIRLHKHLFTSLLLHAIISALLKWHLLKSTHNRSASDDRSEFSRVHGYAGAPLTDSASEAGGGGGGGGGIPSPIDPSSFKWPSLCLVLSVLLRYFRSVNYLWMFNEALYLHQLIKHAFSQPSLRPLIILAYSLPFITTTSYIFARSMAPFTLEPTAFVEEAYAEGGAAGQLHTAATAAAAGNDQHSQSSLYSAQQLVDSIYAAQQVGLADQADGLLSSTGGNSQPAVFLLSLDDQQMNDRVHYALSSLIRSSPAIRHQLMTQQDSSSSSSSSPEPDSWLNDLLAGGGDGNNHRQQFLATAERLVAEESTTTEPTLEEQQNANGVLANFDAFEDVSLLEEEDNCWLMPSYESWHEWIINVPNLAILIINCFFLLWLLRVLCIKAAATMISNNRNNSSSNHHHHQNQHPPLPNQQQGPSSAMVTASPSGQQSNHQHHHHHRNQHLNGHGSGSVSGRNHYHQQSVFSRQSILVSLRAAVLLLPLYGLHYLVIVYRPKIENCWLSETYHYLSLSLDGLQGLAISIIFCFANSEIRHLLTRSLQRVGTRQRSTTIYMTEVAPTNRD